MSNKIGQQVIDDMEGVKLKFDGETHLIEANTFINTLLHFTTIVQEVNKALDPDKKVEVKIRANQEGSFIADIVIQTSNLVEAVRTIFSAERVSYAANLLTVVTAVYGIAQFLKGSNPRSIVDDGANCRVENNSGQVSYFDFRGANIYISNNTVKDAIAQEFSTLEADNSVTGFEILDKDDNPIINVPREEFTEIASPDDVEEENEKIITEVANLNVITLDLELRKKWDFYYNGHRISAKIKDGVFAELINKGERFGKGDSLTVEMDIRQVFVETVNTYVNKSYTINRIISHNQRPPQGRLDL